MPFAPSSFLLLVVRPGAPRSVLVTTSKALVTRSDALVTSRVQKESQSSFWIGRSPGHLARDYRATWPCKLGLLGLQMMRQTSFHLFPECVVKGSRLTLGVCRAGGRLLFATRCRIATATVRNVRCFRGKSELKMLKPWFWWMGRAQNVSKSFQRRCHVVTFRGRHRESRSCDFWWR